MTLFGVQWQNERQWRQGSTQENLIWYLGKKKKKKVKLLSWKKSNTGKSFPDRLWNDHPQKCPKFKWTGSEHPTLVLSALSGGWTRSTPDVSSNLNYFIKDLSVTGHSIWQYILYHYKQLTLVYPPRTRVQFTGLCSHDTWELSLFHFEERKLVGNLKLYGMP